jgi:hypothetical protein
MPWGEGITSEGTFPRRFFGETRSMPCAGRGEHPIGENCSFEIIDLSSEELVAAIRAAKPGELFTEQFRLARIEGIYPPQPED